MPPLGPAAPVASLPSLQAPTLTLLHHVTGHGHGGALGIGAASPYIPVAMRVRLPVAHDDLADGLAPSLGGAAILPDETCYQQVFEIGCRHTRRIAARVDYSNTVRALGPAPESV